MCHLMVAGLHLRLERALLVGAVWPAGQATVPFGWVLLSTDHPPCAGWPHYRPVQTPVEYEALGFGRCEISGHVVQFVAYEYHLVGSIC